jgi:hypothetical protein
VVNLMTTSPTDEQLFAQIADQVQALDYLLQFAIQRMPNEGAAAAYLLRVAKRHAREVLSFARSGLGVQLTPEQMLSLEQNLDYIMAKRATAPAAA